MSDLNRARARAETFAHAVDHGPRHSARLADDPELQEAVDLVGRLRTAGAVAPRPEFGAELRHRLMEQAAARAATKTPTMVVRSSPDESGDQPDAEDVGAPVTSIRQRHGRRIRLVASTAALVLLGGGIGSAAAAQQAMPGDSLYGMKRSIEDVSTSVTVGDDSRGRRDLEHAMTRLSEVQELAVNGGSAPTINATLDAFSAQARKGVSRLLASYQQTGDEGSITAITTFITNARQALGQLAPQLPPESLKSAVEALATVEQLAQHTAIACPNCAAPQPSKGNGTQPSTEPVDPANGVPTSEPSPLTRASTTPKPAQSPNAQGSNTPPPSALKTPPSSHPSTVPTVVPSVPTPGSTTQPWLLPTLPLPTTPIINIPGVLETLLPPWK